MEIQEIFQLNNVIIHFSKMPHTVFFHITTGTMFHPVRLTQILVTPLNNMHFVHRITEFSSSVLFKITTDSCSCEILAERVFFDGDWTRASILLINSSWQEITLLPYIRIDKRTRRFWRHKKYPAFRWIHFINETC